MELMVPTVEFPPMIPLTDQSTAMFVVPVTVTAKLCCALGAKLMALGATVTMTPGGGTVITPGVPPPPPDELPNPLSTNCPLPLVQPERLNPRKAARATKAIRET